MNEFTQKIKQIKEEGAIRKQVFQRSVHSLDSIRKHWYAICLLEYEQYLLKQQEILSSLEKRSSLIEDKKREEILTLLALNAHRHYQYYLYLFDLIENGDIKDIQDCIQNRSLEELNTIEKKMDRYSLDKKCLLSYFKEKGYDRMKIRKVLEKCKVFPDENYREVLDLYSVFPVMQNQKLVDVRVLVPSIIDAKTFLVWIRECTRAYFMMDGMGRLFTACADTEKEVLASERDCMQKYGIREDVGVQKVKK